MPPKNKRSAEAAKITREESARKKAMLSRRIVIVIFKEHMERYEELKAKVLDSGCKIIHEDQMGCAFVADIPPNVENPLDGYHEDGAIDVIVNVVPGPVKESGVDESALEEAAQE